MYCSLRSAPTKNEISGVLLLVLLGLAACTQPAMETPIHAIHEGKVTDVFDGDSIIVQLNSGDSLEVRLAQIDAPEHGQPFAAAAKANLSQMVLNRQVRLLVHDEDRYGRQVARVLRVDDSADVNLAMVATGHAWAYRNYLQDIMLLDKEREARLARIALWSQANPIPPWEWRRSHE